MPRRPIRAGRVGPPITTPAILNDAAIVSTLGMRAPHYLNALERAADDAARMALWIEVGDALALMERWDRVRLAWDRALALVDKSAAARAQAAGLYWRLGALGEGLSNLSEATSWYERAAEVLRREGALQDEALARMALARVTFHLRGGGEARQHARDAVLAVREAVAQLAADSGEGEARRAHNLLGEALELSGEVALDLGLHEEAIATLREAVRQHERARLAEGVAEGRSSDEVRATVALAEALLESGQVLQAVTAYEAVEDLVESHDSAETRGRGMALFGLVNLELGKVAEATEPLRQAHAWYEAAGATLRRARLHVATARRVEDLTGAEDARVHYERAWALAQGAGDELRLAPIGYALARCYMRLGEWVRADDVIAKALIVVQNAGDLEGLGRCTELGVKIAMKLAQGRLALERLLVLARTRGRLGERFGEIAALRAALSVTLAVPGMDPVPVASELMESLRQVGTEALGPGEALETAEALAKRGLDGYAREIAEMEADKLLSEGRPADGARTLAKAAAWSLRAGDRWGAIDLWDRAIGLGAGLGLAEVEHWGTERAIAHGG